MEQHRACPASCRGRNPSTGRLGEVSAGVGSKPHTHPSYSLLQGSHPSPPPQPGQLRLILLPASCGLAGAQAPRCLPHAAMEPPTMQPSAAIEDRVSLVLPPLSSSAAQAVGYLGSQTPPLMGYNDPFPPQQADGSLGQASLLLTSSHSPALVVQRGVKAPQSLSSAQVPQRAYRVFVKPTLYQHEAEPQGSSAQGRIF